MRSNTRLTIGVVIGYLAVVATGWWLLSRVVMTSYLALEADEARDDAERGLDAVDQQRQALEDVIGQWSSWDDTWTFMVDRNPDYLKVNQADSTYRDLDLDLMVYLDPAGDVLYARAFDRTLDREVPVGEDLLTPILRHRGLVRSDAHPERLSGLLQTGRGPVVIASAPILKSDGSGPVHGTLLFGRILEGPSLGAIRAGTHLALELLPWSPGAPATTVVEPVDEQDVRADAALLDIDQRPIANLRLTLPRTVYHQGVRTLSWLRLWLVAAGGLAAVCVGVLLTRHQRSVAAQRATEGLYSNLVNRTQDGIVLFESPSLAILEANPAMMELLGLGGAAVRGRTLDSLPPFDDPALRPILTADAAPDGSPPLVHHRRPDGSSVDLELSSATITQAERPVRFLFAHDVTERSRAQQTAQHAAHHDTLTGLPNRRLFEERLAATLALSAETGAPFGVTFIDLDGFKEVNDTLGHLVADKLLVLVARRLGSLVRAGDTVARQGGDEFLLLLPGLEGDAEAAGLGARVVAQLSAPFQIDGREVRVSASVGSAVYPHHGTDAVSLIANADMAMYQAKAAGRNGTRMFDPAIRAQVTRTALLRDRLSHALTRGELQVTYQPLFDLRTGRIASAEALLRWMTPEGPVSPAEFIPIAEQSGLILSIGEWVLDTVCREAARWEAAGAPPIRVAVNLSARQFVGEGLIHVVREVLVRNGLRADRLELEVTESLAMASPEHTRRLLEALRESGVSVALDDFGTGYSSLAYLREFPFDRIKIDRSFLAGATENPQHRAIVSACIALSHALGLEVVGEGVETDAQAALLRQEGCDLAQGYGLARPMLAEALLAHLLREQEQSFPALAA